MRAGPLDRRITIQRKTVSQAPSGQEIDTWVAVSHCRPARVTPLGGSERFGADQFFARQQVEIEIRWSSIVADLNPLDRIVYPAPADPSEQSPAESQIYDIMSVDEIGRREGLLIKAARRAEIWEA